MERRLIKAIECAKRLANKAYEQENWDAYDKHMSTLDLLTFISEGTVPISTNGYFHSLNVQFPASTLIQGEAFSC